MSHRNEEMTGNGKSQDLARQAVGFVAVAVSLLLLLTHGEDTRVALACSFLAVVCVFDTLYTRIPNWATLGLLVLGLGFNAVTGGLEGLVQAGLGCMLGFFLFLLAYLMGGMGAGDVKALAALGALLGPAAIFSVGLYTGVAGGVLAVFHYAMAHDLRAKFVEWRCLLTVCLATGSLGCLQPERTETLRFPYAAAIACGFFAYVWWGTLI